MAYESVDQLQKLLANEVFVYAKDSKKAAGRALGTLVEIITFYLLKSWGFEYSLEIERRLPEYGNPEITHNVEYTLHPIIKQDMIFMEFVKFPITSSRIYSELESIGYSVEKFNKINATLMTSNGILRNSCLIGTGEQSNLVAILKSILKRDNNKIAKIVILEQYDKPYSIFECKRVGIEEGVRKGPQTIEKAKQGAYVAKSVSNLYKIRLASGELHGLICKSNNTFYSKPYNKLIAEVIASSGAELLRDFILTVGVVSNHGNWFTSENHNKELKVLAQSYDWLLFLADEGLAEFVTELLLKPKPILASARDAFLSSYNAEKTKNQFTKVQMNYNADQVLNTYFRENKEHIISWFNIITPKNSKLEILQSQISSLRDKNWKDIHTI